MYTIHQQELNNKIRQQAHELEMRIKMAKTSMASDDDLKRMNAETKVLAKAAIAAAVKQELLEKRLAKIHAKEMKKEQVKS